MSIRKPRKYIRHRPGAKPPPVPCDQCQQTPCQTVQACGRRRTNQEQAERLRREGR